jgi:hypothetical protein
MLQIAQMLDVTIEELLQTGEELVEQEEPDTPAAPEQ